MPRIIRINAYKLVLEIDRGKIVAYRKCWLSFRDIALRIVWYPSTVIRQWITGCYTKRHAISQCPPWLKSDRHIVKSVLKTSITTSRTMLSDDYFGFPWQWNKERDNDSGAPSNNSKCRNDAMPSFQTSSGSAHSILMTVYLSGGTEETARRVLKFDISIGAFHLV